MPKKDKLATESPPGNELPAGSSPAGHSSGPSKKALRQQRQRANAQKRIAQSNEIADEGDHGPALYSKKQKLTNTSGNVSVAVVGAEAYRETHGIRVDGECPAPSETFGQAKSFLHADLVKQLRKQGFSVPTPIQAQVWPLISKGQDLVAIAKTGSGKTCGYLLPAFSRIADAGVAATPDSSECARPSALVLAPTRELVQQIAGEGNKFLIGPPEKRAKLVSLFGGVEKHEQVKKLRKGADIAIATPGRLLDLATGDKERKVKPSIALDMVSYFVLDEADRMLDMGFEPSIRDIAGRCQRKDGTRRQTLFFTATWPKGVQQIARSLTFSDTVQVRIGQGAGEDALTANASVTQVVTVLEEGEKFAELSRVLAKDFNSGETAIVFAATKDTCDMLECKLSKRLEDGSSWCAALHSGKDQKERNRILRSFRTLATTEDAAKKTGVLISTDVAARGLDIPGVALVIIYDFGGSRAEVESYVHRIGRTGRAGKSGRAITFFTRDDRGATELVEVLRGSGQVVPSALQELAAGSKHWKFGKQGSSQRRGGGRAKGRGKSGRGY